MDEALETWQTFVPERPLNKKKATVSVETNTAATTPMGRIHSLQDDTWKTTQKANARIVKRSSESVLAPTTASAVVVNDSAAVRVKVEHGITNDEVVGNVVGGVVGLEDVPRRDMDLELFAMEMERRPLRPSQQLVLELPPPVETLAYCAQFKTTSMPWFVGGQRTIAANPDLAPPVVPLYTRAYLQPFMREPDPRTSHERPCCNLDREPHESEEGLLRCVAHRLSEQRLGPGQGYRLRELLNTTQCTQINAALAHRGGTRAPDPAQFLPKIPELCVMCHVWMVTEAVLDQKDRVASDTVAVLNRFMVDIDKPGEYSRHCLLAGDAVAMGIWGPFPLWNERNYVLWKDPKTSLSGLRGFQELEDMLFRLSLDPSQPSTRTSATAVASKSLH